MKRKFCLIPIFVLICFSLLSGYTLPESVASGELLGAVTAKHLSLGGAVVLGEEWTNPALYTETTGLKIELGVGLIKVGERRKRSVFDSFENRVGDVTVADNGYVFSKPSLIKASLGLPMDIGFGIDILPVQNYDYRYSREVRDDFYVLKETIKDEGKGELYLVNFGAAYEIVKGKFSLGFALNLYSGDREWNYSKNYIDPSTQDICQEGSKTLKGNGATFGIIAKPFERVYLGGCYTSKASIGDMNTDFIPQRTGIGIKIIPPNSLPAVFMLDAIFENWTEVSVNYEDVLKLHLGVGHKFTPCFSGRFGFGYETSYLSSEIPKVFFTSGFGYVKDVFEINTGLKICTFNYTNDELNLEQHDMEGVTAVEESLVKVVLSISYGL